MPHLRKIGLSQVSSEVEREVINALTVPENEDDEDGSNEVVCPKVEQYGSIADWLDCETGTPPAFQAMVRSGSQRMGTGTRTVRLESLWISGPRMDEETRTWLGQHLERFSNRASIRTLDSP